MSTDERPNGLREARERAGLTQTELASRATITVGAISQFERGDKLPSLATALALARILDSSVEALFGAERIFVPADSSATLKGTPEGGENEPQDGVPTPADRTPSLTSSGEDTPRSGLPSASSVDKRADEPEPVR